MITMIVWMINKRTIKFFDLVNDYPILFALDLIILIWVISWTISRLVI
ncbi:MAG: hypothetical protein ACTSPO_16025 [Candidatus Heimdallarchaeaceae archaeon]